MQNKSVGHFQDGKEYIIESLHTLRPLLNYIWNARILSGINHFGGGVGAIGQIEPPPLCFLYFKRSKDPETFHCDLPCRDRLRKRHFRYKVFLNF